MPILPKISIVTPCLNHSHYLEETIKSVLSQDYPNLEYIIIDGGSTDGSLEIIKQYEEKLAFWSSEPDDGLYFALEKGFSRTTGEIMGWLNSDDLLHPNALFNVAEILNLPHVQWMQGMPSNFDERGRTVHVSDHGRWSQVRLLLSKQFIQQESTFWRRELWEKAGSRISTDYRLAGDYELWSRFFLHADLYTPMCLVGGFRLRARGQLSMNRQAYIEEVALINSRMPRCRKFESRMKSIRRLHQLRTFLSKSRMFNFLFLKNRLDLAIQRLEQLPAPIMFDRVSQEFVVEHNNLF